VKPEALTSTGLIFGQSASASSRNVYDRLRALEALCPFPKGVVADLGCGQGGYTIELERRFNYVLATDIQPANIEHARTQASHNTEFYCAPLENTPIDSERVDAAFVIEVLDHVNDVRRSLEEVRRILKPFAKAYISVPNALFPFETHPIKLFCHLLHPIFFPEALHWCFVSPCLGKKSV
jgi:ubiquinone/menaquinone biosynthesis C-methylase UbiE